MSEGVLMHASGILDFSFFFSSTLFNLLCLGMVSSNLAPACIVLCEKHIQYEFLHVENMLIP